MHHCAHMHTVGIKRRTHHPANFAMLFDTFPEKIKFGAQDEIALHLFPYIMELIMRCPNVGTRTGELVLLCSIVINAAAGMLYRTNIALAVKNANRVLGFCRENCYAKHQAGKPVAKFWFHGECVWMTL